MWDMLKAAADAARDRRITDLFAADPHRAAAFSVRADGMLLDCSKTKLTARDRDLILSLLDAQGFTARRDAMFRGAPVNETEHRAALHTALRDLTADRLILDGTDILGEIRATRAHMTEFAGEIRADGWTDVVNIGIGGSHLGPEMATSRPRPSPPSRR
jgi:glucose-6-phosphate isomerase